MVLTVGSMGGGVGKAACPLASTVPTVKTVGHSCKLEEEKDIFELVGRDPFHYPRPSH